MIPLFKRFPNDEDGKILKALYRHGLDFSQPQDVDFFIAVSNQEKGLDLLKVLKHKGFSCELIPDDEKNLWTCCCYIQMLLTYDGVIEVQQYLNELSVSQNYNKYPILCISKTS